MDKKILTCPNCHKEFEVDESSYASLLSQVRSKELEKEFARRDEENKKLLDAETNKIRSEEEAKVEKLKKDFQIQISKLESELKHVQEDKDKDIKLAVESKNSEINALQELVKTNEDQTILKINNAISDYKEEINKKDKTIMDLNNKVALVEKDAQINLQKEKEENRMMIKMKDEEIDRWRKYRIGLSTKGLGESLENYCSNAFEEIRNDAYKNATFIKDNDDKSGSKGDFIFKDYSDDGVEIVSIMFEMKNQNDITATKHKNEDFYAKLNKDRNEKNCEYAVLVSMLEEDNELFNKGIVDVSHKFKKMYVVRPTFFLAIISLIRNMALNTYQYKKELIQSRNEHIDITKFEDQVKSIASKIATDYQFADNQYSKVENMCDSMIKKLQDFKEAFRLARKHIGTASDKVLEDLSIRKLTKNNETMKNKFENISKEKEKDNGDKKD